MTQATPNNAPAEDNKNFRKAAIETRLRAIFRLAGYGLLASALLDVIAVFVPPNFDDPVWRFKVVGDLVERMPVPLMGLILVFYGELSARSKPLLKTLSILSLLVGIAFLALIPLGLVASQKINDQNNLQIGARFTQQIDQIKDRKTQLGKIKPEDLDRALTLLNNQGKLKDIKSSSQFKSTLFSELAKAEDQIKSEADNTRKNLTTTLVKNSVKWTLGALLAGIIFILFWRITSRRLDDTMTIRPSRSARVTAEQVAESLIAENKQNEAGEAPSPS